MKDYEVIIIGGSYAGLSAAMALGRHCDTYWSLTAVSLATGKPLTPTTF